MRHNKKAVRCVETGQVYSSAVEASLSMGKTPMAVAISISKGCRSGGYLWQYVEDDKKKVCVDSMGKIFGLFQNLLDLVPMSDIQKAEKLAKKFELETAKCMDSFQS